MPMVVVYPQRLVSVQLSYIQSCHPHVNKMVCVLRLPLLVLSQRFLSGRHLLVQWTIGILASLQCLFHLQVPTAIILPSQLQGMRLESQLGGCWALHLKPTPECISYSLSCGLEASPHVCLLSFHNNHPALVLERSLDLSIVFGSFLLWKHVGQASYLNLLLWGVGLPSTQHFRFL